MRKSLFLLLLLFSVSMMYGVAYPLLYQSEDRVKMMQWVDSVFYSMSEDERLGQLFMVIADPKEDASNMTLLTRYVTEGKIGGVLFHKGTPTVQASVTNRLQKSSRVPLFIALDGEWGLSMRLRETTRFPKNMMLGALSDLTLIEAYGEEVGRQCREMGIHINFAPVIDVNSNAKNPVIGLRAFGDDAAFVSERGRRYALGLESMRVLSVAKHFPGHGDTSEDSHFTLPRLGRTKLQMEQVELYPFDQFIRAGFAGVMSAHLYVPAYDSVTMRPASLSYTVVNDLLKGAMGFKGLCFTDALAMKGASQHTRGSLSLAALLAGNDVLLAPVAPLKEIAAVKTAMIEGRLKKEEVYEKCKKILCYKYITGLHQYRPIQIKGLDKRLNTPHANWLAAKMNAEAITLLKNREALLPLKSLDQRKIASLVIGDKLGQDFHEMVNAYDSVATFRITSRMSREEIARIMGQLSAYDVVLCGVFHERKKEFPELARLAETKTMVTAFFTSPYTCEGYRRTIEKSAAVVMAYEGTPLSQQYAAQLIFGGIAGQGRLPVTIEGLFPVGAGMVTAKTRLGYHHPKEVGMMEERLLSIDTIVEEGLRKRAYPGCQLLVAKEGMVVYHKSYGYHDFQQRQRVTSRSVYDLASVTKPAGTLLAVMKAYDQQQLGLSDPIANYLPELDGTDKSNLTVEELLYHQSGLPPILPLYTFLLDSTSFQGELFSRTRRATHPIHVDQGAYAQAGFRFLPEKVSRVNEPPFTHEVARDFFVADDLSDRLMEEVIRSPLKSRGSYQYGCLNFILLKMMMERLLASPMDQWLRSSFYDRLGAYSLTYRPLQRIDAWRIPPTEDDRFLRKQQLQGYVHDEMAALMGGVSGNAGLFSSANDLAKVLQLFLSQGEYGGERYLSANSCQYFTNSRSKVSRRGLGFDRPELGSAKNPSCGELTSLSTYGHTGYTGTCFWVDPESRLIYIFLSNRVYPTRTNKKLFTLDIRTRIQDAIYKSMVKEEK